ncbi:MAG: rRNA maturation RNase YbeY [Endomicrobia bacterium]|nr:rRNA maturation RNase YbeY [Endomicrobiia bacterium]
MLINLIYKTKLRIINPKKLKKYIKRIIDILFSEKLRSKLQFNFVFLDNKKIKKFNKKYLNRNYSTDILCFRYDKINGDFLISLEQVKKNAKIFKNKPYVELLLVVIHGLLHFKGMDDETEVKRKKMEFFSHKVISKILKR